jgi:hypothetical protein
MLTRLFHRGGLGSAMAASATAGLMDEAEVRLSCEVLVEDLGVALRR